MVEIAEIDSRETLKDWLDATPQGTRTEQEAHRRLAVTVAWRSAARALGNMLRLP